MNKFLMACVALLAALPLPINANDTDSDIHPHGYWVGEDVTQQHKFDPVLAEALVNFFKEEKAESIVDFGCGLGDYVKRLLAANFDCIGYDGNPETESVSKGVAQVKDLSVPFHLGKTYDWVLCLEVGEHLPKQFESNLLINLHRHNTKGIVLSWAVPGQGGYGHFNEQPNHYIKSRMAQFGYVNDVAAENILRANSTCSWYRNTLMVFRKKQRQPKNF